MSDCSCNWADNGSGIPDIEVHDPDCPTHGCDQ